ncbi:MAG: CoA-binding protein [Gammaproteobacteria bacterium]|nr:CoA-binding protein [Gammaproteobacteria bacterium]
MIDSILSETLNIAIVGASDKSHRASYGVMQFLQKEGYRCIPVSPRLAGRTLLGEIVYAKLEDIDESIDMVDLFINSGAAGALTDSAISIGAKSVWMQLGVINEAAAIRATRAGLKVIMDHCPVIEIKRRK